MSYISQHIAKIVEVREAQTKISANLEKKYGSVPIHFAFGYEVHSYVLSYLLKNKAKFFLTHRNIVYNLAQTENLELLIDYYTENIPVDVFKKYGSMNLAFPGTNVVYSSSILANNLSVCLGYSYAFNNNCPCVVTLGDGASEEGALWEFLVMLDKLSLPVLVVLEDNNFSMSSTILERRNAIDFSKIIKGFSNITHLLADSLNIVQFIEVLETSVNVIESNRPCFLHVKVPLLNDHHGPKRDSINSESFTSADPLRKLISYYGPEGTSAIN